MKRLVILAALVGLSACSAIRDYHAANPDFGSSLPPYERIQFAAQFATPDEKARCEAAGGMIRKGGRLGWEQCVQSFADAGKACSGSEDCLGECRLPDTAGALSPGTPAQGFCQADDLRFGCHTTIESGKVARSICID